MSLEQTRDFDPHATDEGKSVTRNNLPGLLWTRKKLSINAISSEQPE